LDEEYSVHHDRECCSEGGFQSLLANVEADQEFSDLEQCSGDNAAKPDIAPTDLGVGEPFEHHRKK